MGFKRKQKVYKLDFTGTEYEGLEIRATGLTTGEFLDFVAIIGTDNASSEDNAKALEFFARHMISWNVEDDDDLPVPATYEGLKSVDFRMAMLAMTVWSDALSDVPEDAEKKSGSGDSSLVASIPTTAL